MGDRIELLGGILRRRVLRTEQQWALTQPFLRQLVMTEAQSIGRDVDEALNVIGVPDSLRINAETNLPAIAHRAIDGTSNALKALSNAARRVLPETEPGA